MTMTTEDTITAALLNTCHHIIQSFAQSLTTLHSINAIQRLQEDANTFGAFLAITSFAPFLLPAAKRLSKTQLEKSEHQQSDDGSALSSRQQSDLVDSSGGTLHRKVELEDGLELGTVCPAFVHQDGLNTENAALFSKFLHPVPAGTNPSERPLYSFLVYFPSHSILDSDPWLPIDREMVMSIIYPVQPSLSYLSTHPYPRFRLLEGSRAGQRVLLIMDDDTDRLHGIYNRFIAIRQSEWVNANSAWG